MTAMGTTSGRKHEIEMGRERATLTQYLDAKAQPVKQYLTAQITEEEVRKATRKLEMKKATGDDAATGEIIKRNEDWVEVIIHKIFKSMEEGGK